MKAKEKFEEWCIENYPAVYFPELNEVLKWGVYLEFFDSEGIIIIIDRWCCMDVDKIYWDGHLNDVCVTDYNETRQQAQA